MFMLVSQKAITLGLQARGSKLNQPHQTAYCNQTVHSRSFGPNALP